MAQVISSLTASLRADGALSVPDKPCAIPAHPLHAFQLLQFSLQTLPNFELEENQVKDLFTSSFRASLCVGKDFCHCSGQVFVLTKTSVGFLS